MKKKLPVITMDEWLQAEERAGLKPHPNMPKPKGSRTRQEHAKALGIPITTAGERLRKLVELGEASVRQWGRQKVYFLNKNGK